MVAQKTPAESRQLTPTPETVRLAGERPGARTVVCQLANTDYAICRPLGYKVRLVTLIAPDNSYSTGGNSDSVYVDIEEVSLPGTGTPAAFNAPVEIPPGKSFGWEEIDPGWLHVASPTSGTRILITYGGRTATPTTQ